jgi:hypothetical protein
MNLKLNEELRQAISQYPGQPLRVEDPVTNREYVVIAAEIFDRMQQVLYDDTHLTGAEMMAAARHGLEDAQGWGAPGMDVYDQDSPRSSP